MPHDTRFSGNCPTSRQKMDEQSDYYDPDERARYRDDHNLRRQLKRRMLLPADRV
jgi:hypothetical protein